jgi:hypothetical protein
MLFEKLVSRRIAIFRVPLFTGLLILILILLHEDLAPQRIVQHVRPLNGFKESLSRHLLVSLLLPSANDSLPALGNSINNALKAINKVTPFLMGDGASDLIPSRMIGELEVHVFQVLTPMVLIEVTLKTY